MRPIGTPECHERVTKLSEMGEALVSFGITTYAQS
jgi:hypothetical protein